MVETQLTRAERDVIAERRRQVDIEGFDATHDDLHAKGQIAAAAATYALSTVPEMATSELLRAFWPWAKAWWKSTTRRQNLVKAAALILAEIERLDRADMRAAIEKGQTDGV